MPIIKSAIKRVRTAETKRKRNLVTKTQYKTLVKQFETLIADKKTAEATKLYPKVQKSLDMAVKKNLLHKNNVARKKSQLAKMLPQKAATAPKAPAKKAATAKKEA